MTTRSTFAHFRPELSIKEWYGKIWAIGPKCFRRSRIILHEKSNIKEKRNTSSVLLIRHHLFISDGGNVVQQKMDDYETLYIYNTVRLDLVRNNRGYRRCVRAS